MRTGFLYLIRCSFFIFSLLSYILFYSSSKDYQCINTLQIHTSIRSTIQSNIQYNYHALCYFMLSLLLLSFRYDLLVGLFAVFGDQIHFVVNIGLADVGVAHDCPPEVDAALHRGVAHQHFAFLDHVLFGQYCHIVQHFHVLLLVLEVLQLQLDWQVPKTNIECLYFLNSQLKSVGMGLYVLFNILGKIILFDDLVRYSLPAVPFQVDPQLEDIQNSTALQRFVAGVQIVIVRFPLLMKQVIGCCGVAILHNSWVLAQKHTGLQRHQQPFVRVPHNRVHIFAVAYLMPKFGTCEEDSAIGCIQVQPYFMFLAYFTDLLNFINRSFHSGPNCCAHHKRFMTLRYLLFQLFIQIIRSHSASLIRFNGYQRICSKPQQINSLLQTVVRCFRCQNFQWWEMLNTFLFNLRKRVKSSSLQSYKIAEGTSGSHDPVDGFPLKHFSKVFIHFIFHESKTCGHFVRVHVSVQKRNHNGSADSILIETPEQGVVEMRMVRLYALIQYFLNDAQQLFLRKRLLSYFEVDHFRQFLRLTESDHSIFSFQGGFCQLHDQLEGIFQIVMRKTRVWIPVLIIHFIIRLTINHQKQFMLAERQSTSQLKSFYQLAQILFSGRSLQYNHISQGMGICPSISPEERATKQSNKFLKSLLMEKLRDLTIYSFSAALRTQLPSIQNRFLFNEGILQDIDTLVRIVEMKKSIKTESLAIDTLEDQLKNSCLIIEDQVYKDKSGIKGQPVDKRPETEIMHQNTEYQKNLAENESLVCQINIIYQRELDISSYHNALKLFLKWSSMFHEHFYGGFLKQVYKVFCNSLYKTPIDDIDTIVDETSVFVQYMVAVYTDIYHLRDINQSENGSLFKNQNVFNLIMASMFKKTKIKVFIRKVIKVKEEEKIKKFQKKLGELQNKELQFFGVEPKFQLRQASSSLNDSTLNLSKPIEPMLPSSNNSIAYNCCRKLIENLCENSQTPITKLKLIVQISKNITSQIYQYYDSMQKEVPELDPDNLTGIIMYLICKVNRPDLYEELKIAEYFTTGNCLTCISGYYLNVFNAAIETLLTL